MLKLKYTDCGNDISFIELTTSEWYVDESAEREKRRLVKKPSTSVEDVESWLR